MSMTASFSAMSRRQKFFWILVALGILTVIFSFVTRIYIYKPRVSSTHYVAVVGPMSGDSELIGQSLKRGAELFVDQINRGNNLNGNQVALIVKDDENSAETAKAIAEEVARDERVIGVVGHASTTASQGASEVYANAGIPVLTPSSTGGSDAGTNFWQFKIAPNVEKQTKFLANYALNVMGEKVVSIIHDTTADGVSAKAAFSETYEKFKTSTHYEWSFDQNGRSTDRQLQDIAKDVGSKVDTGAIFLATDAVNGAKLVKYLRDAGHRNVILGYDVLAGNTFSNTLAGLLEQSSSASAQGNNRLADYTNGIFVTSPLLFDTAGEDTQDFKNEYIDRYQQGPDWVGANAYEAVRMLVSSIQDVTSASKAVAPKQLREAVRDDLTSMRLGNDGESFFDDQGEARKPIFIGTYNGQILISALTQLQPILEGGVTNYIDEFRKGRVLYVNDRFMYKTNVVYTGVKIEEITDLDQETQTARIAFNIWFRYRGDFEPQNLVFFNAITPIKLENPVDEQQQGDMTYRLYRVEGDFATNYQAKAQPYGYTLVGLNFSHDNLNKDNLQYVIDYLGLDFANNGTFENILNNQRVINPALGMKIDRAWIAQDIVNRSALGNPKFVGHGTPSSEFSTIDVGIVLQQDAFSFQDFVPSEYFTYIAIFGLLGALFAVLMDRGGKRGFWNFHSWILRVVAWPALLLACGNIALDFSVQSLSSYYTDIIVMIYDIAWWILPARLTGIAIERFIWMPLEKHTGRVIPNVIRVFVSTIIYAFAGLGVVAFVLGETVTSLLATSGLLAMIIGLAVQSNIANIFSGIILNVERPFSVNDWIKIDDLDEGKVIDITWRTTRFRTRNGHVVSIPNGRASESDVYNFSMEKAVRLEIEFSILAGHSIEEAEAAIVKGIKAVSDVLSQPAPESRFLGTQFAYGKWVDSYEAQIWIDDYSKRPDISEEVCASVWNSLREAGLAPKQTSNDDVPAQLFGPDTAPEPA